MTKKKYYGLSKKFPKRGYETKMQGALRLLKDDSLSKIHYVGTIPIEKDKMPTSMKRTFKTDKMVMNPLTDFNKTKHLSSDEYTRSVLSDIEGDLWCGEDQQY